VQIILSDHNCEGQAEDIFKVLEYDGDWLKLVPMKLKWFRDVGLSDRASDKTVWQFCQKNGYILLTGNRSTKDGSKSLELTIRHLVTPESLPVLTISNLKRINSDPVYRKRCAEQMAEIVDDIERYRGTMRLFLS
jgi:predicted nuclease of predicted toxin-antitoxin system